MRIRIATISAFLVSMSAIPSFAATQGEWNQCNQTRNPDASIAACTRIIQSGDTTRNRSIAYNDRGNAYQTKRDLDRAIAEYNESIRRDPK